MPRYSDERRQAVVAKLLPPYNQSVEDVAREEGISSATVYKWSQEARCLPDASDQGVEGWSSRDKFAAVIESAAMNAEEIAAYCRQHGWPLAPLLNTLRWHVESLRKMDPPSAELESQATAAEHPFEGRIDACVDL
jgi:hypothetical protein